MPDGHSQTIARLIRLHETDNVAIVANDRGLPAGSVTPDGLTLTKRIPLGHKVALADISQGAEIRRYGTVIGTALEPIPRGAWAFEARVRMPEPPDLATVPRPQRRPNPLPKLEGYSFEGFRNPDGSVGTRNVLAGHRQLKPRGTLLLKF